MYNLSVVSLFEWPNNPGIYAVWGFMPLVGSRMANRSQVMGQTKSSSEASMRILPRTVTSPSMAQPGSHPGPRPAVGTCIQVPGGGAFTHRAWISLKGRCGPCPGLTTCRGRGRVQRGLVSSGGFDELVHAHSFWLLGRGTSPRWGG